MENSKIIVKLGSSTLTDGTPHLSLPRMFDLVRQVVALVNAGHQVILVTSGAIAAGKEVLRYPQLPEFMPRKQMLAAVGQPHLMSIYDQFFRMFDLTVAQVLLTRSDLSDRERFLKARSTMLALLSQKVIPIVNENDTVSVEEIRFGDNDTLSAQVANLVEADLLVLLTDQAGLYTGDPRHDPTAKLIPEINEPEIPEAIWSAAGGVGTGLGTGGMITKIKAADLARRSGVTVQIACGSEPDILLRIARQEPVGSIFRPVVDRLESRKRYLLAGIRSTGVVSVDKGAAAAIRRGGSLLPVGVVSLHGDFDSGDTVRIANPQGKDIAIGLPNYDARELAIIAGHKSTEIEQLLGYSQGDEVIHHNNMILL